MPAVPRAASASPSDTGRNEVAAVGRLVQAADFKRLLATPMRSRSAHFAAHHVGAAPAARAGAVDAAGGGELSTDLEPACHQPVDDLLSRPLVAPDPAASVPNGYWLGCVVPKRHARRAVTRSLLKRQMRVALERHAARLPPGMWLLRLRAGFSREQFRSASSQALRDAARRELDELLVRASR